MLFMIFFDGSYSFSFDTAANVIEDPSHLGH